MKPFQFMAIKHFVSVSGFLGAYIVKWIKDGSRLDREHKVNFPPTYIRCGIETAVRRGLPEISIDPSEMTSESSLIDSSTGLE